MRGNYWVSMWLRPDEERALRLALSSDPNALSNAMDAVDDELVNNVLDELRHKHGEGRVVRLAVAPDVAARLNELVRRFSAIGRNRNSLRKAVYLAVAAAMGYYRPRPVEQVSTVLTAEGYEALKAAGLEGRSEALAAAAQAPKAEVAAALKDFSGTTRVVHAKLTFYRDVLERARRRAEELGVPIYSIIHLASRYVAVSIQASG